MKTILVTGSSGLIGSDVCQYFAAAGWTIHGVDNNQRAVFFGPHNGNFVKFEVDYRDGAPRLVSYAEKNGVFAFADTTGVGVTPSSR